MSEKSLKLLHGTVSRLSLCGKLRRNGLPWKCFPYKQLDIAVLGFKRGNSVVVEILVLLKYLLLLLSLLLLLLFVVVVVVVVVVIVVVVVVVVVVVIVVVIVIVVVVVVTSFIGMMLAITYCQSIFYLQ